jgi:hypothetical protein
MPETTTALDCQTARPSPKKDSQDLESGVHSSESSGTDPGTGEKAKTDLPLPGGKRGPREPKQG